MYLPAAMPSAIAEAEARLPMQNVHLTAYSPLGTPDSAEMMKRKGDPKILEDSTVGAIASELGKTPAQVDL